MKLTIMGLYNYDPSIFDNMQLPDVLDRDTVINNIIMECGEFEALYPDPDIFKMSVGIWSRACLHKWQRICDALYKNYDAFINFTRDETRTTVYTPDLLNTTGNKAYDETEIQDRLRSSQTGNAQTVDTFHSQGDSALFTPTDVARKETELRLSLDMQEIIINDFKKHLVVAVY